MRALVLITMMSMMLCGASACSGVKEGQLQKDGSVTPPRDVAGPPADALRTPSGLASKVLRVGLGTARPGPRTRVAIHYTGWTTDGKTIETTLGSAMPAIVALDQVIPGWTEGLQLMVPGEKRRFWVPPALAHTPGTEPPPGMLVFDVELLEIR